VSSALHIAVARICFLLDTRLDPATDTPISSVWLLSNTITFLSRLPHKVLNVKGSELTLLPFSSEEARKPEQEERM